MTPTAPFQNDPAAVLRAALWMLGAVVSFSTMAIAGREVSFELDTFEIMMYRSLIGLTLVVLVAGATGAHRSITARKPGLHLVRNVFHFGFKISNLCIKLAQYCKGLFHWEIQAALNTRPHSLFRILDCARLSVENKATFVLGF